MKWHPIFPNEQSEDPIMSRAVLIETRLLGVYLHRFKASEHRPLIASHDHPWDFFTLVLQGGYDEMRCGCHEVRRQRFAFGFRKAETIHRLRILPQGATTLCVRGPKRRDWSWVSLPGPSPRMHRAPR